MTKRMITLVAFMISTLFIMAQNPMITKSQAIEDIDYFVAAAEQAHINLYAQNNKSDFLAQKEAFIATIDQQISVADFQVGFRKLINSLGDGHTYIGFSPAIYRDGEPFKKFPFQVRFVKNQLQVVQSDTPILKVGSRITAIDNKSIRELKALSAYATGEQAAYKLRKIEESLAFYYQAVYGSIDQAQITVSHGSHGHNKTITLIEEATTDNDQPLYHYKELEEGVGLLTFYSFMGNDIDSKAFNDFLETTFADIKKTGIKKLVIDIRDHAGGNSQYGTTVLSYLNVKHDVSKESYQLKTSKPLKKYIRKSFLKWYMYPAYPFLALNKNARMILFKKNGTITDLDQTPTTLPTPINAYKGEVVLLTSATTYSAAADFAVAFKQANRGLLIGENINQPYTGYIDQMPLRLPHSQTPTAIAYKKYSYIGTSSTNQHKAVAVDKYVVWNNYKDEAAIRSAIR